MSNGKRLTEEQIMFIRRNFSDMTNQELADRLGICKASVSNVAYRFCLRKSKEHDHRMGVKAWKAAWDSGNCHHIEVTPEVIAKRRETYRNTFRQEKARKAFGLPQRTKMKVTRQPRVKCYHRFYLKSRGYIIDDTNFIAYWTPQTRRSPRLEAGPKRFYKFEQLTD